MTFVVLLRGLVDAALAPLSSLPPLVGLTLVSALIGVGLLLVFKVSSDQLGLAAVKRQIHAHLFEIRLFNDDLRAITRALLGILRHNLTYLGLSVVPLLWMAVPLFLILTQLQFHYGYRGLEPGEQALLKVELKDGWSGSLGNGRPQVALEAPSGLQIEAGPVWIPSLGELTWRISASEWGDYALAIKAGGQVFTKSVRVSDEVVRRSPVRLGPGFVNQLLYPAEDPLPAAAPINAIMLTYPGGNVGIVGWDWELTWMFILFAQSMAFAFALRRPLKVTF